MFLLDNSLTELIMPFLGCCFLFITSTVASHFYSVKPRNLFLHAPGSYLEMGKGLEGDSATEAWVFRL